MAKPDILLIVGIFLGLFFFDHFFVSFLVFLYSYFIYAATK